MNTETMTWPRWLPRVTVDCAEGALAATRVQFKPANCDHSMDSSALFVLRPVRCKFCWRRYYWVSRRENEHPDMTPVSRSTIFSTHREIHWQRRTIRSSRKARKTYRTSKMRRPSAWDHT